MKIKLWWKIAGLLLISLFAANLGLAQTNDSIVSWEADVAGLSMVAADAVPSGGGTFWVVSSNNLVGAPFPCAPTGIESDPTYLLPNGSFLVDGTAAGNGVSGPQLVKQMNAVSNLIVQAQTQATVMNSHAMGIRSKDLSGPPSPGGGGGTNDYPPSVTYTPPDYGTNLWIAQWGIVSNSLTGIASNTVADVMYAVQTNADLTTTNWADNGQFILGSETTNWTAFVALPVNLTNNLFFRLQSEQSSDGSGLPDWWEQEYFGTTGIDPYGDPAGDGYSNFYKFQHGMNPNTFYQPTAPQGLVIQMDNTGTNATLSWQGVAGNVSGYTIYAVYPGYEEFPITVGTASSSQTTYSTTLSAPYVGTDNAAPGFYVTAQYTNGISSSASAVAYVESEGQQVVQIIPDAAGHLDLAVVGSLPADAASILLFDGSANYTVAVSNLVNGLYVMPDSFMATNSVLSGQILYTNGQVDWEGAYDPQTPTPFYDGRAQLKENLIFQLRSAVEAPLHFSIPSIGGDGGSFGAFVGDYNYPTNYAYAGLYQFANLSYNENFGLLDPLLPFEENCLFANFVVNLSDVNTSGNLVTGVASEFGRIDLNRPLTYQFQTNGMGLPDLLATNLSHWMYPDNEDPSWQFDSGLISYDTDGSTYFTVSMADGFRNWFGLPYDSTELLWGNTSGDTTTLNAANSVTDWPYYGEASEYPGTAEPRFQTVEYDFWNTTIPSPISSSLSYALVPGNPNFLPTNASQQLFASVGSQSQIAGYAKLEVANSAYPGVYGYLGQYFDHAYQIDTNGMVTTNTTGVLSPYGNFFPTQPGPVALVTMPDPDTGERGTGMVNCVSLNVDANHDGNIDLSFNGADATSQSSPMRAWVNNRYCTADGDLMAGNDVPANYSLGTITGFRDLENFFRLWICGIPVLTNGYQVTLNWANVTSGNPGINLYQSVEADGGTGYLTDTNIALQQLSATNIATGYGSFPYYVGSGTALARITNGTTYTFPANYFTNNSNKYFLFEGAGIGAGELFLTISDSNGNRIAQTGIWLDLHDVDDLFQRVRVTPRDPNGIPEPYNESSTFDETTAGVDTSSDGYDFTPPANEDQTALVFVHGSNLELPTAIDDGETMFKRLYWQGYNGRFVLFYWNTLVGPFTGTIPAHYNENEYRAFKYGLALKNYVENDLPAGYTKNVIGHSMGNMVVTSALYPRGSTPGMTADNVIFMQAAVPASCYDPDAATLTELANLESPQTTPDSFDPQMGYRGLTATNINATLYNIYNANDYALNKWVFNQHFFKPENLSNPVLVATGTPLEDIYYDWSIFGGGTLREIGSGDLIRNVTDPQESMSFIARSRTAALGTMVVDGSINVTNNFNVGEGSPTGLGRERPDHSGEFTRPIQELNPFYSYIYDTITKP